ncbi:MAG: hypothetical protein LBQ89_08075 [Treponema sp.]|jgi:hypothetical protein|nr:hypothetical protein [Treponema sp.]
MSDKYIFCPYCKKSTWVRVTDYDKEEIGGYLINTAISNGKCEMCGRQIKFVEVFGIEIDKPTGKEV